MALEVLYEDSASQEIGLRIPCRRRSTEALIIVKPDYVKPAPTPSEFVEELLHCVNSMEELESIYELVRRRSSDGLEGFVP